MVLRLIMQRSEPASWRGADEELVMEDTSRLGGRKNMEGKILDK